MKLTKFAHACFTLEKDSQVLVVDPGEYATDFVVPENVVGVVITHEHPDHFDYAVLEQIIAKNPEALVVANPDITAQLAGMPIHSVTAGDQAVVGPFNLEFFGGHHAPVHPTLPIVANLGVLINEKIYYPGDSFTLPGKEIDMLALPVAAPWLTIGEVFDFLTQAAPARAFPTHDAILSDTGKQLVDDMVSLPARQIGTQYYRLTEPLEIDG